MTELLQTLGKEQTISRRSLFRGVGLVAMGLAGRKLHDGVRLNSPKIFPRPITVGKAIDGMQQLDYHDTEENSEWVVRRIEGGRLLFESSGADSLAGLPFEEYAHRGGNSKEAVIEAYEEGASLFDVDANNVLDGRVYTEHGIIPQIKIAIGRFAVHITIPMVIDVNESELKLALPDSTYEEIVALIGSLNTPERPLAVSTELKRGEFDIKTINSMFAIHIRHGVPVIIKPSDSDQFDFIDSEIALLHETAG